MDCHDDPVQLAARYIGDDWTFEAHRTAGSSDWTDPIVTIRRQPGDGILVATSRTDDAIPEALRGSIILDGVNEAGWVVPESDLPAGDLWLAVPRSVTVNAPPMDLYLELSVIAAPLGRQTRGLFVFRAKAQTADEP